MKSETTDRVTDLETKLHAQQGLHEVTKQIHSLPLDEVLLKVKDSVQTLLQCERVTIYAKERGKNEIFSKVLDGKDIKEIRLPVNKSSMAGWVAEKQKGIRIKDVYDPEQTQAIDPSLKFNSDWDKKSGFRTRQVLAQARRRAAVRAPAARVR